MIILKKISFFLILLISAIVLLVVLLITGFVFTPSTANPNQSGWVDNMWSCMGDWMSGSYPTNDPYLAIWGVLLIVAVGIVILGIGGVVYFFLFPEIRNTTPIPQTTEAKPITNTSSFETVLKTLNSEERKVINVLKSHGGKYLQKYIRHETGLSRLKTHRILSRFVERGIVTLQKSGNTNEVTLADWLR